MNENTTIKFTVSEEELACLKRALASGEYLSVEEIVVEALEQFLAKAESRQHQINVLRELLAHSQLEADQGAHGHGQEATDDKSNGVDEEDCEEDDGEEVSVEADIEGMAKEGGKRFFTEVCKVAFEWIAADPYAAYTQSWDEVSPGLRSFQLPSLPEFGDLPSLQILYRVEGDEVQILQVLPDEKNLQSFLDWTKGRMDDNERSH